MKNWYYYQKLFTWLKVTVYVALKHLYSPLLLYYRRQKRKISIPYHPCPRFSYLHRYNFVKTHAHYSHSIGVSGSDNYLPIFMPCHYFYMKIGCVQVLIRDNTPLYIRWKRLDFVLSCLNVDPELLFFVWSFVFTYIFCRFCVFYR